MPDRTHRPNGGSPDAAYEKPKSDAAICPCCGGKVPTTANIKTPFEEDVLAWIDSDELLIDGACLDAKPMTNSRRDRMIVLDDDPVATSLLTPVPARPTRRPMRKTEPPRRDWGSILEGVLTFFGFISYLILAVLLMGVLNSSDDRDRNRW
jgi:hypothetical protein